MKTVQTLKYLIAIVILFAISSFRSIAAESEAEANFITTVKSSFQAKDVDKFMALECWDGSSDPEAAKKFQIKLVTRLMQNPLVKAELITIAPTTVMPTTDGLTHKLNLTVTKKLKVTLKSDKIPACLFFVGEKDGKLLIANEKKG